MAATIQALPPQLGRKLRAILIDYLGRYDEETFALLNNRTVRQIFSEYRPSEAEPLATGEVDGIRYALHDKPPKETPEADEHPET